MHCHRNPVEAAGEAVAIVAHELAHVARMDWIKLLLAQVATPLFWFNPLVWMLAREAHQRREKEILRYAYVASWRVWVTVTFPSLKDCLSRRFAKRMVSPPSLPMWTLVLSRYWLRRSES